MTSQATRYLLVGNGSGESPNERRISEKIQSIFLRGNFLLFFSAIESRQSVTLRELEDKESIQFACKGLNTAETRSATKIFHWRNNSRGWKQRESEKKIKSDKIEKIIRKLSSCQIRQQFRVAKVSCIRCLYDTHRVAPRLGGNSFQVTFAERSEKAEKMSALETNRN